MSEKAVKYMKTDELKFLIDYQAYEKLFEKANNEITEEKNFARLYGADVYDS